MTIAYDGLDLTVQGPLHPDKGPPGPTPPPECFLVASVLTLYTIHKAIGNFVDFQLLNAYFYRLPMKLWEGNVFTGVCHSVGGGPM